MASEEARSMLDALMGGDRNAPLPRGAAIPSKRKLASDGMLLLPGKRQKSVFDADVDPLYTAWGVDVYDLFVNTKSDLGANPYVVDEGARQEYLKLTQVEQERLGFEYFLFQKLQELVRQCDRIVNRNKEKLSQELQRKLSQRGGQDFVEDVDDEAVEHLARTRIQAADLSDEMENQLIVLEDLLKREDASKQELEQLLEQQKAAVSNDNTEGGSQEELQNLQKELGLLVFDRQRLLFDIAGILSRLGPLQESAETLHRNLNYVKSDISTDKTVCEVSGNFMSARDADERIAAHYAGKQYVGWKLVRDKFNQMVQRYGRFGPPPPQNRNMPQGSEFSSVSRGSFGRGSGGGDRSRGGLTGRGRGRFDAGDRWERHGPPMRGGPPGPPRSFRR